VALLQACASKEETTQSFAARVNLEMAQAGARFENDPVNRQAFASTARPNSVRSPVMPAIARNSRKAIAMATWSPTRGIAAPTRRR
jgi:hypothetical protein